MKVDNNDSFLWNVNTRSMMQENVLNEQSLGILNLRQTMYEACTANGIVGVGERQSMVTYSLRGTDI